MKDFYTINKWFIIITLLLYLTFWGGIMSQMILGLIQIMMSISIIINFSRISTRIKNLFKVYIILTLSTITIFQLLKFNDYMGIGRMFYWLIVSMGLAIFHLYITYKIKNDDV